MNISAAMTATIDAGLSQQLLRSDGQEDVCLATYAVSTGATRTTALIDGYLLPRPRERTVHGNASFTGDYIVRAAVQAAAAGRGVVTLHSHPGARGWQIMSAPDHDTERSYAHLVSEMTGLPLIGMTLAGGDGQWSCRSWISGGTPTHGESVRVIGDHLRISWNDRLRPAPEVAPSQVRTRTSVSSASFRILSARPSAAVIDVQPAALNGYARDSTAGFKATHRARNHGDLRSSLRRSARGRCRPVVFDVRFCRPGPPRPVDISLTRSRSDDYGKRQSPRNPGPPLVGDTGIEPVTPTVSR